MNNAKNTIQSDTEAVAASSDNDQPVDIEEPEGLGEEDSSWGRDYPLDEMLIRHDHRTVREILHRINEGRYVMNPDFQREFIWDEIKQSKLIESVLMRVPLPVFYLAEDETGRMVVVDGLQRLSTFKRFVGDGLRLRLPDRKELHRKRYSDLPSKFQNRVEDCDLILYSIESKTPEQARMDIFERVNGGVPLTRQQMRNCLYMGPATRFLKDEVQTEMFQEATGGSLNWKTMRDREFVNRFCAFHILGFKSYSGDMDHFLAQILRKMNKMGGDDLANLSADFRRGLANNYLLFGHHAFRKYQPGQSRGSVLNASLWDVMCAGLAHYEKPDVESHAGLLRQATYELLANDDFNDAITYATNAIRNVKMRFEMVHNKLREVLGAAPSLEMP